MTYYAGIDVSLDTSSICLVEAQGPIRCEFKVESQPEVMAADRLSTEAGGGHPAERPVIRSRRFPHRDPHLHRAHRVVGLRHRRR